MSAPIRTTLLAASRRPVLSSAYPALCSALHASSQSASPTSAAAPKPATSTPAGAPLDWDSFLQLRKLRRRYNLVSSIFTSAVGTSVGLGILGNKEIDVTQTIMGMDPLIMFGLGTVGCGAAGWLVGPAIGGAVFNAVKSKYRDQIAIREKEFLHRIQKHRVDPSSQSMSNPVPDYYGEKITSVKGYRQWLKDQRAYKLKREKFV